MPGQGWFVDHLPGLHHARLASASRPKGIDPSLCKNKWLVCPIPDHTNVIVFVSTALATIKQHSCRHEKHRLVTVPMMEAQLTGHLARPGRHQLVHTKHHTHATSVLTFCMALTLSGKTGFLEGLAAVLAGLDSTSSGPSLCPPAGSTHCLSQVLYPQFVHITFGSYTSESMKICLLAGLEDLHGARLCFALCMVLWGAPGTACTAISKS